MYCTRLSAVLPPRREKTMEVFLSTSSEFEELITTDYATAKLIAEIHKETSVILNYRYWRLQDDKAATYYKVSWKKGR